MITMIMKLFAFLPKLNSNFQLFSFAFLFSYSFPVLLPCLSVTTWPTSVRSTTVRREVQRRSSTRSSRWRRPPWFQRPFRLRLTSWSCSKRRGRWSRLKLRSRRMKVRLQLRNQRRWSPSRELQPKSPDGDQFVMRR